MKGKISSEVTSVLVSKRNKFYKEIDDYMKSDKKVTKNPLRKWSLFRRLYNEKSINYIVDGVEKKRDIEEFIKYPFIRRASNGNYFLVVPDTRHISRSIKEEEEGKEIKWVNKMGLWSQTLITLINKNCEPEDVEA